MAFNRRDFLKVSAGALGTASLGSFSHFAIAGAKPRVVVVGGGYGGATCARYLKLWDPKIDVTLIEMNDKFVSCPLSNTVLGGINKLEDLTFSYNGLKKAGVKLVKDEVIGFDTAKRLVKCKSGKTFAYDRLVLSGGIELRFDLIEGFDAAAQKTIMHAWKAGPQTATLRKQLEAMPDGGVYALSIPPTPYRCPPGPYERVCMVANYFKAAKPKSKILVLDSNSDIVSKKGLFLAAWKKHYDGMIEYRPNSKPVRLDAAKKTLVLDVEDVKADVLNVVPPMRAHGLTALAGVRDDKDNWCTVDFRTLESKVVPNVHIIGDSISAPTPKSGSMANNYGKVCAAAIVELFKGGQADNTPVITNTCFSATSANIATHVATVWRLNAEGKWDTPKGASGVSKEESELEWHYMESWAKNIWADTLAL